MADREARLQAAPACGTSRRDLAVSAVLRGRGSGRRALGASGAAAPPPHAAPSGPLAATPLHPPSVHFCCSAMQHVPRRGMHPALRMRVSEQAEPGGQQCMWHTMRRCDSTRWSHVLRSPYLQR